ncbi:MAG TPA: heterodisulfide reductase-related iron-sulfur binding cluster [Segeticoccus sp.]|uniref:heterodisulfide reductase-related iron-sulfur binding cluster n=1 Tax=Segeticoccus sp. TaxID=2706531 RepID=UPI002D7EF7CD|nr:heterodisulfide reductase-related iron-sulfur binding cluster [Segeticoccus sp.]HET8599510.1 heterodisulfide reductase-related iron-sulfur binding cluster [Segeticoccus sp.]
MDTSGSATTPVTSTAGTLGTDGPLRVSSPSGGPAFDDHRPPSQDLIDDCVHCGFCLPTCPTYNLWGEEMDSPRGRIYLMGQGLQGEPLSPAMVQHFDACLGCMACVTACPSGVQYDKLIEATRAQVERRHPRSVRDRALREAIFALFPYPQRLRLLRGPLRLHQASGLSRLLRRTGVLQRLSPTLAAMESLAPAREHAPDIPERTAARGTGRGTVGILLGCVQREFFPGVNAATVRVLAAEGFDVIAPPGQGCCGALSVHNGREAEAQRFARALIDRFEEAGVEHVVVNSAGCGSSMKEYADLLADDPAYAERAQRFSQQVWDVAEFLAEVGAVAERHPLPVTVAYHDACHLAHAQRVRSQPRQLLHGIPELSVREVPDGEICCGSAGIYNLLQPDAARELGDKKAANIERTHADLLVAANPGCLMQVASAMERKGTTIPTAHTIEVLDASIRGLPASALLNR